MRELLVQVGQWLIRQGNGAPTLSTQQHIDQLIAINHSYQKKFIEFGKQVGALGNKHGDLERRIEALELLATSPNGNF